MGVLKKRIKKYNKYVIEIENEEIEANNLKNVEDVIIIRKEDFERDLHQSKELKSKLESRELELKLKSLKLQEKDLEIQKAKSDIEEFKETYKSELVTLEKNYINKENELKILLENRGSKIDELKKEYCELEEESVNKENELKILLENKDFKIDELKKEHYKLEEELVNKENELTNKANSLKNKDFKIDELKKEYHKLEEELVNKENKLADKSNILKNKLEEKETLQNQMEVYRIGNVGLKNEIRNKEKEIDSLKNNYNRISDLKSRQEKEMKKLRSDIDKLEKVQIEHNKLINNYRHLQEVANKKDRNIIELEAQKRKLEQYLSMSLEAITTLKNLGLFNRLFNRVPEGIDELQEDIKKLQPPREVEIEPVRVKKTSDILGEKK